MITGGPVEETLERPVHVASLWHNREYLLLWIGQGISTTGSQVSQFAFPLLILALFRSPALAGIGGALVGLPYFFLALPAGVLVDRWNRKRLMIVCDIGRGLVLFSMTIALLIGRLTLVQAFICALIEGCLFVFVDLASDAATMHVVAPEQHNAMWARRSFIMSAAYSLGQALAGILLSFARFLPFLVDAISYLVSIVTVAATRRPLQDERSSLPDFSLTSMLGEIREGIVWVWHKPVVRLLTVQAMLGNALENGQLLLFVVIAVRLHVSVPLIGVVFGLAGLGALVGSLLAEYLSSRLALRPILITCQWVTVGLLLVYLLANSILVLGLVSALLVTLSPIQGALSSSYRVGLAPDVLRGRVIGVMRLVAYAGPSLGLTAMGVLLQTFDVVPTVLICSAVSLMMAVLLTASKPLRQVQQEAKSE